MKDFALGFLGVILFVLSAVCIGFSFAEGTWVDWYFTGWENGVFRLSLVGWGLLFMGASVVCFLSIDSTKPNSEPSPADSGCGIEYVIRK